jgi:phage baseplate assembly protein W
VPVERISQGFKDISASFKVNPVNDDLIAMKNENAIARSVRNLVVTIPGEKPFSDIGSRVTDMLFENMDMITSNAIKDEIESTIRTYEPRVELQDVVVKPDFDSNQYDVTVNYIIIGIDVPTQSLTFVLEPTR